MEKNPSRVTAGRRRSSYFSDYWSPRPVLEYEITYRPAVTYARFVGGMTGPSLHPTPVTPIVPLFPEPPPPLWWRCQTGKKDGLAVRERERMREDRGQHESYNFDPEKQMLHSGWPATHSGPLASLNFNNHPPLRPVTQIHPPPFAASNYHHHCRPSRSISETFHFTTARFTVSGTHPTATHDPPLKGWNDNSALCNVLFSPNATATDAVKSLLVVIRSRCSNYRAPATPRRINKVWACWDAERFRKFKISPLILAPRWGYLCCWVLLNMKIKFKTCDIVKSVKL